MADIAPLIVDALPPYTDLDGENADNYYRASQRRALLSSEIIDPFIASLKDSAGYSDENIPDEEVEVPCDIGQFRFSVKVTPTKKRPGYKDVYEEVDGYLRTKLSEYKAGERPGGIYTLDGEPYLSSGDVLTRIKKTKRRVIAKGVKREISHSPVPSRTESMVVPLGMDMAELTEGNVSRYLEACSLLELYKLFISAFENELLGMTGYSNDSLPETTEHLFRQMGRHVFHVKSIPYESISYGKVISGLDAEPGKKKPEKGGDLVLVTRDIHIPRLDIYRPKQRDGDHLVRLNGLLRRMDRMVKESTETKVRQKPITHYPIV